MAKEKLNPRLTERAERILLLLEENGNWSSGERLSELLGISRAAVSKQIAGLRLRGHVIQSVSGRGHRLLLKSEHLDVATITEVLQTERVGKGEWRIYQKTTSTNDEAIRLALAGAASGSVVVAEQQSQGRGRKGHAWFSAPHGLMFSVLLRPALPAADLVWLTAVGVFAVAEAIEESTGLKPVLKVPNDVLLGRRKVAGVLLETGMRGGELDWAVLGIGCNVNTLPEDFPPPLRDVITSIFAESAKTFSRSNLLAAILNRLDFWYGQLESGNVSALRARWEQGVAR